MSDPTSSLGSLTTPISQTPPPASQRSRRKTLLAAFVSAVFPGAGHFLINRHHRAFILLFLFCALIFICWPLRLPSHFGIVLALVFGMLALCIFAAVDASYGSGHRSDRPSQWWLVVLLPLAFGTAFIHVNWALRSAGFQTFVVPSRSMENTVPENAHVMVDRWYYRKNASARGDIIIFINPEGIYLMKRMIAQGGETIEGQDGLILIDGKPLSEPYVIHTGGAPKELDNFGPLKIPPGKLFVMGDNRDISLDSRMPQMGLVDVTSLRGRPLYTLAGFQDSTFKTLR